MIIRGRLKKPNLLKTKAIKEKYGMTTRYSDADYVTPEISTIVSPTDLSVVVSFNKSVIYDFYKKIEPTSLTKFKKRYFFDTVYMGLIRGAMSSELSGVLSAYFNSVRYYRFWLYLHEGIGLFAEDSLATDDHLRAFVDKAKTDIAENRMRDHITFSFEDSSSNIFGTSAQLSIYKGQAKENALYQISCPLNDSTTSEKDGFNSGDEISIYITNGAGSKVKVDYEAVSKEAEDGYTIDITKINDLSLNDYQSFNMDYWRILTSKESGIA